MNQAHQRRTEIESGIDSLWPMQQSLHGKGWRVSAHPPGNHHHVVSISGVSTTHPNNLKCTNSQCIREYYLQYLRDLEIKNRSGFETVIRVT